MSKLKNWQWALLLAAAVTAPLGIWLTRDPDFDLELWAGGAAVCFVLVFLISYFLVWLIRNQSSVSRMMNWWWPDVSDLPNAEKTIRYGFWTAVLVASITAVVALMAFYLHKPILGIDGAGLVDAVLFAAIAFGIYRRSRAAAIGGLVLYVGERAYMSHTLPTGSLTLTAVVMTVIYTMCFVHGVRGTVAYRKLSSQPVVADTRVTSSEAEHGVTRGLTLKIIYGTIVSGIIGVLVLHNSPQFLDRYSPRLGSYLKGLGLVEKQAPGNVFGMHTLPDGTQKAERVEFPDGEKDFDMTRLPDGAYKKERIELPDGEKWFEMTRLQDGTEKVKCVEFPDGEKDFDMTRLPDGTQKVERVEFPDGEKHFDTTVLPDGTKKAAREEFPDGEKHFDTTELRDGSKKVKRAEFPNGEKDFDVTRLPDGTYKKERIELPDGEKDFDTTDLPDGTQKAERVELPHVEKDFDTTELPDGTKKAQRIEFPDGEKWFEVTRLPDGTYKVKCVESSTGKKRFDVTIRGQSDNTSTPKYSGFAAWKARQSKSSASDPFGIRRGAGTQFNVDGDV